MTETVEPSYPKDLYKNSQSCCVVSFIFHFKYCIMNYIEYR